MTTAATDILDLTEALMGAPMRERIWAKTCQDLHEHFILAAVSTPAWPLSTTPVDDPHASWILPGNYTLDELQDRFAPRLVDSPATPDLSNGIIVTKAIEAVSGVLRALLLLPAHVGLVADALARGGDLDSLHRKLLAEVGVPLCAQMIFEVSGTDVALTPEYLRGAGQRRVLSSIVTLQERQHTQRTAHADKEAYGQLLKRWKNYSGDLHSVHIEIGSPLSRAMTEWLDTLLAADAKVFLDHHNASAKIVAYLGLPKDRMNAIVEAVLTPVAAPYPDVYSQLRALISTIMGIPGYRRLTVTSKEGKCVRVDIDQFNRIGTNAGHSDFFVNLLLTGLMTSAGVMVRAFQAETINVFVPATGTFAAVGIKNMYGALLDKRQVIGLTSPQVYGAMTKSMGAGPEVPREPSIRCLDWPAVTAAGRKEPPPRATA